MDRTQGNIIWSLRVILAVEKQRNWPDCEVQLRLSCSQIWKQKVSERNVISSNYIYICSKSISSEQAKAASVKHFTFDPPSYVCVYE